MIIIIIIVCYSTRRPRMTLQYLIAARYGTRVHVWDVSLMSHVDV